MQKMLWLGVSEVSDTYHLLLFCHPSKSSDLVTGSSIFKNYNVMARKERHQDIFFYYVIPPNRQIWSRDLPYLKTLNMSWLHFVQRHDSVFMLLRVRFYFYVIAKRFALKQSTFTTSVIPRSDSDEGIHKIQDCFNNKLLHDNK